MNRVANFIDGGYLDALLRNEWDGYEIDYKLLTDRMSNGYDLLRSYYYHCPPYIVDEPTDWQKELYEEKTEFFKKLETVPRFENRLGQLQYRGKDQKGHAIYEQKRVDLMFGVDLVMLATKGLITHASILAGDSDFIPALHVIKSEGVVVHLFCGKTPHDDLRSTVDEVTVIDKKFMESIAIKPKEKGSETQTKKKSEPKSMKAETSIKEVDKPKPKVTRSVKKTKKTDSKKKVDLGFLSDKK